jgi:PPOX class probable FMN-dependent enzyme
MPLEILDPVSSAAELDAMYSAPMSTSIRKVMRSLTSAYRAMVEASPFLVIATTGPRGLDCSPRGDAPGFVRVHDDSTLLVPERRGNNRIDTLRNLVADPRASLLFMVPGISEVLRVNGCAALSRDASLCEAFAVGGAIPKIVIVFQIEQVMFQCARAIVRSKLWDPATFRNPGEVATAGAMLADATAGEEGGAQYDAELPARIQATLY